MSATLKMRDYQRECIDALFAGILRCPDHAHPGHRGGVEITAEDLPDGGICSWGGCGKDLLT